MDYRIPYTYRQLESRKQQDMMAMDNNTQNFTSEWVQNQEILLIHHEQTIQKAMELKNSLLAIQQEQFPELSYYFPQTVHEIEIQEFNLNLTIPQRLFKTNDNRNNMTMVVTPANAEVIAFWILEKRDLLNSESLCKFLQQPPHQPILYSIATKICSLEIGQEFIDGLKYYLPVCGFWKMTFPLHPLYSSEVLEYILEMYVKAHLTTSQRPLLSNTLDHFTALMEIGKATIELCQHLQEQKKASTMIMSEFYQKVRLALRKTDGMTLSVKSINSLFATASASLISDITPSTAARHPSSAETICSYLFTTVEKVGIVSIGISYQDDDFPTYEAYLCQNAMYLFPLQENLTVPPANKDTTSSSTSINRRDKSMGNPISSSLASKVDRKKLYAVIPLKNIQMEKSSMCNDQEEILHHQATYECFDKMGEKVCWILYQEGEYQAPVASAEELMNSPAPTYSYDIPSSIEYFDTLILRFHRDTLLHYTNGMIYGTAVFRPNTIEEWVDTLQDCCWQV